jgi:hypothetical protein
MRTSTTPLVRGTAQLLKTVPPIRYVSTTDVAIRNGDRLVTAPQIVLFVVSIDVVTSTHSSSS